MPRGAGLVGRAIRQANKSRSRSPSPERSYNSDSEDARGPRSFPHHVKVACWEKAATVPGRDPDRWRVDAAGNVVFRKLTGCQGCFCYDFDHIVPYSLGGPSSLENCQVLQTADNRAKGNRADMTIGELQQESVYCNVKRRDLDTVEWTTYGDVTSKEDPGGCKVS